MLSEYLRDHDDIMRDHDESTCIWMFGKKSRKLWRQIQDLKVENFIVIHDHVDRPAELLSVGPGVHLQIYVKYIY